MLNNLISQCRMGKRDASADLTQLKAMRSLIETNCYQPDEDFLKKLAKLLSRNIKESKCTYTGCHLVCCIALNEANGIFMINNGVLKTMIRVLSHHKENARILGKALAAIWNLLGAVVNASDVPSNCFKLIWATLLKHPGKERVVYATIGALSNLALVVPNQLVSKSKQLRTLKNIFQRYRNSVDICTQFAAFVANICVSGTVANKCAYLEYVPLLVNMFRSGCVSTENILAALHNMSDTSNFIEQLCMCQGVELLHEISNTHEEAGILEYIDGIYAQSRMSDRATSSLHVAAVHGLVEDTITILMKHQEIDLNSPDLDGLTACDLAIQNGMAKLVELLVASGASFADESFSGLEDSQKVKKALKRGKYHRAKSQKVMKALILKNTNLIQDMGGVVAEFIPGVDMLLLLN